MSLDHKALKKLADTCRKAGIKHFKNSEIEFTLTEDVPLSTYKKKVQSLTPNFVQGEVETDSLSQEDLLFWSAPVQSEDKESN